MNHSLNTRRFHAWRLMLIYGLLLFFTPIKAQSDLKVTTLPDTAQIQMPHKARFALGVGVGTNSLVGADIAVHLLPFLNVRAGYNYFTYENPSLDFDYTGLGIKGLPEGKVGTAVSLNQSNIALIPELALGKRRNIRLAIGGVYSPNFKMSTTITYKENVVLGDFVVTPEEIGYMRVNYTIKSKISPYFGFGLGKAVPKKRIGVSWDMGAYYRDSPVITIDATGMLTDNKSNEAPLNRNLSSYKWYPVSTLRLAIRLND